MEKVAVSCQERNQRFKLVPPTAAAYDEFGSSVAVHGSRVVVGARAGGYGSSVWLGAACATSTSAAAGCAAVGAAVKFHASCV